ncbi:YaaC family protein [Bacillaceae bacterium Marseille-Q3522]|nr:YaaC family protein [Bacillaceae bacterium Marseille-Q3522]
MIFPVHSNNLFSPFFSAEFTQKYLQNCYEKKALSATDKKSFENCYRFMYYLEHGQIYYQQAVQSPILIQPILLFYGLGHFIKAAILTVDPSYPETTAVLSHGVSTRKRKKQQYSFFEDEVKIQRNGLFCLMAEKMFHMERLEGEKWKMKKLLQQITELEQLFLLLKGSNLFLPINKTDGSYYLSKEILDHHHMTMSRFKIFLQTKAAMNIHFGTENDTNFSFLFSDDIHDTAPLRFNSQSNSYAFPILKESLIQYPELLIHYLLLYNLSMIARYETEWWNELLKMKPDEDYPFIQSFLAINATKGPQLIARYLYSAV